MQIGCNRSSEARRTAGFQAKGRGFESISLQQRVCELSVPRPLRTAVPSPSESNRRSVEGRFVCDVAHATGAMVKQAVRVATKPCPLGVAGDGPR